MCFDDGFNVWSIMDGYFLNLASYDLVPLLLKLPLSDTVVKQTN